MLRSLLLALAACVAVVPAAASPADPADARAAVPQLQYRSAFENYRSHKVVPPDARVQDAGRAANGAGQAADPHAGHAAADSPSGHEHAAGADAKPHACARHDSHHAGGRMMHDQGCHTDKEGGEHAHQ